MNGFAKIYSSLWDGSLADSWHAWSTFVFMLAHSDANGIIAMTPEAIARRSCMPVELVREAIALLEAADPSSRIPADGGRRIVRAGESQESCVWRIVNHAAYRGMRDPDARREQNRLAKTRQRLVSATHDDGDVEHVSHSQPQSATVSHEQPKQRQRQRQIQRQNLESKAIADSDGCATLLPDDDKLEIGHSCHETGAEPSSTPDANTEHPRENQAHRGDVPSLEHSLPAIGGGSWAPTVAQIEAWQAAYPAVNVMRELAKMRAWLVSNPALAKTSRGMPRFVNRWLARSQDAAGTMHRSNSSSRRQSDARYLANNQIRGING